MRTLLLCSACLATGLFLGTHAFEGKTALEHLQRGWKATPSLSQLKDGAQDTVDGMKKKFSTAAPEARPSEHHAPEDKDAVNRLIAQHAKK